MGSEKGSWGWKLTIHVYVAGERREGDVSRLMHALSEPLHDVLEERLDFVGADVRSVKDRPVDQTAT